ncbi:MAG: hypothetical protein AAF430_17220 [Myxococcota bacterium]
MSDERFRLVFRGETFEGTSPEQARKNLAAQFKKAPEDFVRIFSGKAFSLVSNLDGETASRHMERFAAMGLVVYREPHATEAGGAAAPAPTPTPEPTPSPAPAQRAPAEAAAPAMTDSVAPVDADTEPIYETDTAPSAQVAVEATRETPLAIAPEERGNPPPTTLRQRLRYRFDTFMAKGGSSSFKALLVAFLGGFALIGLARGAFQWMSPEAGLQYGELDFWGNLYISFLQLTDPGNMAQDIQSAPGYKAFAVVAGMTGVILLSALIAFITTSLDQKLDELKRGHSKVIEADHTLILGWNEQRIVEVLRELTLANESEKDACVVILADRDKEEMDDVLRLRVPDTKTTRVVTRSGAVSTVANLDLVSIETSKSAIILGLCDDNASAAEKAASDAMVIQTTLATTAKAPQDEDFSIVAEIFNPTHREIVEASFGEQVVTVNTSDILAKLLVQTSRSVGLSTVYNELLSFDGCEMYFHEDDWGGSRFGDLAYHFPDGVPMGIRGGDGEIQMNPSRDHVLADDDEILIVAEDDSTIELRGKPVAQPRDLPLAGGRLSQEVERELILGWNRKAPIILREFADYVREGSHVDVMLTSPTEGEREAIAALDAELDTLSLSLVEADCMSREALLAQRPFEYDNIIILAGSDEARVDIAQVDSENIVTLLLLRSIFAEFPEQSGCTKLITEVLDSQNHALVARAGVKDVIISNKLVSMIMAQISESRDIKRVYDDLFQEDGSEIYLKPASLYFEELPRKVTFADMIEMAGKRDEVCIGVKIKAYESDSERNNGVKLIPEKKKLYSLRPEDCLIVLAEDEL